MNNLFIFVSKAFIETGQSIRGQPDTKAKSFQLDFLNSWGLFVTLLVFSSTSSAGGCNKKILFHLSSVKLPDNYSKHMAQKFLLQSFQQ